MDFADVEFADAGLHFAHVANDDPDEMVGQNVFCGGLIGFGRGYGQGFLSVGVVIIRGQIELEDLAVGAGKLLAGFE